MSNILPVGLDGQEGMPGDEGVDLIGPDTSRLDAIGVARDGAQGDPRGQATAFKYERGVSARAKAGRMDRGPDGRSWRRKTSCRGGNAARPSACSKSCVVAVTMAHDSVHRFVKTWRNERARVLAQAFVSMSFAPGEAYQFDWSHETITLQGVVACT